jgi:hypothetical protein
MFDVSVHGALRSLDTRLARASKRYDVAQLASADSRICVANAMRVVLSPEASSIRSNIVTSELVR